MANTLFTLKTILQIAFLFNHNKLDFDTRFTDDEWTVVHQDSLMNTVVLDNPVIGQFVFKRIRDTREYSLTNMTADEIIKLLHEHMQLKNSKK